MKRREQRLSPNNAEESVLDFATIHNLLAVHHALQGSSLRSWNVKAKSFDVNKPLRSGEIKRDPYT
jgi:hypothetical protein